MAGSQGERALMVCFPRQAAFSEMMPLVTHPVAKHGLALRVRPLCRGVFDWARRSTFGYVGGCSGIVNKVSRTISRD